MSRILFASLKENAGKTSVIAGLGRAAKSRIAYLKPIGDRLVYRKKQLWDHDASVMVSVFGLSEDAGEITVGFEQSKLRYMYDEDGVAARLAAMAAQVEKNADHLLVEAGRDLRYGCSVRLDALSLARTLDAKLVAVLDGDENAVLDDVCYLNRALRLDGMRLGGVVVNKVPNVDEFREVALPEIEKQGVAVLGMLPFDPALHDLNVSFVADRLLAKVLAGDAGLAHRVGTVLVGSMSGETVRRSKVMQKKTTSSSSFPATGPTCSSSRSKPAPWASSSPITSSRPPTSSRSTPARGCRFSSRGRTPTRWPTR
ncbi:MAG: dethiobiotin synthase [Deltaproteobacteria bacterium]|nr:dethiobiotin synthase [Deltaproteobacteria bacterium]